MTDLTKIVLFKHAQVRKTLHNNDDYWYRMKIRVKSEENAELSTMCRRLKLPSSDGKKYETDCVNTEDAFRIVQSIPSPKAEPFKRWLAKVGYERVQEIENPELATKRTRMLYKLKGYSEDWIEKRMRGIVIREELTDEWLKRGAQEERDYEILIAEISKATFGVTPSEYKKLKGLKRENLRDHMDDFELIFNMLGERATTEIHRTENSKGVPKLKSDAKAGGAIAGGARKKLEKRLKRSVVSPKNFLKEGKKRIGDNPL
ncbi:MAG: BRO family protein [Candidatus Kaiserbacteria bacterium]|nr:BRO family protein [Candidatus Kaiserbacteria bacterium]